MSKLPFMCLNMIVKDEAHIIEETLENMSNPKLKIDYYVISDTGSSDKTPEIIKKFMDTKGIPGEIFHDKWQDFGHNRSLALKHAKGKSQYLWVHDADDLIMGDFKYPDVMDKDGYLLVFGQDFTYYRMQIFRNDKNLKWRYVGVLHEYPDCSGKDFTQDNIAGNYYVDSRRLGARSKDPEKYKKDALVFEKVMLDDPDNVRYMFYCAQSWKDFHNWEKAVYWYKKRAKAGGWLEEVFYSCYQVGTITIDHFKKVGEGKKWIMAALNIYNDRAEPWMYLADYYLNSKVWELSYLYAMRAAQLTDPGEKYKLFVIRHDYGYRPWFVLSVVCFHLKFYKEGELVCQKIFEYKDKGLPKEVFMQTIQNYKFYTSNHDKLNLEELK